MNQLGTCAGTSFASPPVESIPGPPSGFKAPAFRLQTSPPVLEFDPKLTTSTRQENLRSESYADPKRKQDVLRIEAFVTSHEACHWEAQSQRQHKEDLRRSGGFRSGFCYKVPLDLYGIFYFVTQGFRLSESLRTLVASSQV